MNPLICFSRLRASFVKVEIFFSSAVTSAMCDSVILRMKLASSSYCRLRCLRASRSSSTEALSISSISPSALEGVATTTGGVSLFAAGWARGDREVERSITAPMVWARGRTIAFVGVDSFLLACVP